MKSNRTLRLRLTAIAALASLPSAAHASLFQGETLDKVSNVLAWIVLFLVPIIGIAVFWLVHILPEKVAEKRNRPQAKAIQVVCLLSLFFGGMLWPIAWLWAYTKPVLYKMAYGTDQGERGEAGHAKPVDDDTSPNIVTDSIPTLRARISELEAKLAAAIQKEYEA